MENIRLSMRRKGCLLPTDAIDDTFRDKLPQLKPYLKRLHTDMNGLCAVAIEVRINLQEDNGPTGNNMQKQRD